MKAIASLATVVLVLAGVGLVACGDDDDDESAAGGGGDTEVSMTEYAFDPADATVGSGQTITVTNDGEVPHNYKIKTGSPEESTPETFDPGVSGALGAPEQPGEYDVVCTFPGHAEKGMKGTLRVE